jgi:hypothetical protein
MKKMSIFTQSIFWLVAVLLLTATAFAQTKTLTTEEYEPKSSLVTKEHKVERSKFPFVDIHSHHNNPSPEYVDKLIRDNDAINCLAE